MKSIVKPFLTLVFLLVFLESIEAAVLVGAANQLFFGGDDTTIKIRNFETLVEGAGGDQVIDIGERLRGIFVVTSTNTPTGDSTTERAPSGFEVTGLFDAVVTDKDLIGAGVYTFVLEPYAPFAAEIAGITSSVTDVAADYAGAMIAMFNDTSPDFASATIAGGLSSSSDGSLYMVLGADGAGVWGTDYYWAATGTDSPFNAASGGNLAAFSASLALLVNNSGLLFSDDVTQGPPLFFPAGLLAIENEFGVQGNVIRQGPNDGEWPFRSQDPITARVVVPEPVSMLVWAGMGLFGACSAYRRRRNVAE